MTKDEFWKQYPADKKEKKPLTELFKEPTSSKKTSHSLDASVTETKRDDVGSLKYRVPYSYEGNKGTLLELLYSKFPYNDTDTIVDLFGGTGCVGIWSEYKKVIYNEINPRIKDIFVLMNDIDGKTIAGNVKSVCDKFKPETKTGYMNLIAWCNKFISDSVKNGYGMKYDLSIAILTTCFYSWNNIIRFNRSGEVSSSWGHGKTKYTDENYNNIIAFSDKCKTKTVTVLCENYETILRQLLEGKQNNKKFIYADPPYLICEASYNDKSSKWGGWQENDDRQLVELLKQLDKHEIRYMMSNAIFANGKNNPFMYAFADSKDTVCDITDDKNRKECMIRNYEL